MVCMSTRQRAWIAIIAVGCGHPAAPANPGRGSGAGAPSDAAAAVDAPVALEDDLPRHAERVVKLFLDWRLSLEASGTDCAVAAAKLSALVDANADVIEANRKILRGSRERIKAMRAELDKHQASLDASAKAIAEAPAMKKCSADPGFARAVDRLGGEG